MSKAYTPIIQGDTRTLLPPEIFAFAMTSTSIRVDWSGAETDVTEFLLYRRLTENDEWDEITTIDNDVTSHDDGNLDPDTTYLYQLIVRFDANAQIYLSAPSNTASAATYSFDPATLSAVALSSSRVSLAWAFTADTDITDDLVFNVMRKADTENDFTQITSVTYASPDNTYTDEGLPADTSYTYRVDAVHGETTVPSVESAVDTQEITLTATASIAGAAIDLGWSVNCDDNTDWLILRGTAAGGPYTELETIALENSTFSDNSVSATTHYYYVVQPIGGSLDLGMSNEADAIAPSGGGGGGGTTSSYTYLGTTYPPIAHGKTITASSMVVAANGVSLAFTNGSDTAVLSTASITANLVGFFIYLKKGAYDNVPVAAIKAVDGVTVTLTRAWPNASVTVTSDGGTTEFWSILPASVEVALLKKSTNEILNYAAPVPVVTSTVNSPTRVLLHCGSSRFALVQQDRSSPAQLCVTVYSDLIDSIPRAVPLACIFHNSGLTFNSNSVWNAVHVAESGTNYIYVYWKNGEYHDASADMYIAKFNVDTFSFVAVVTWAAQGTLSYEASSQSYPGAFSKATIALIVGRGYYLGVVAANTGVSDTISELPFDYNSQKLMGFDVGPTPSGSTCMCGSASGGWLYVTSVRASYDEESPYFTLSDQVVASCATNFPGDAVPQFVMTSPINAAVMLTTDTYKMLSASGVLDKFIWQKNNTILYIDATSAHTFTGNIWDVMCLSGGKYFAILSDGTAAILNSDGTTFHAITGGPTPSEKWLCTDPDDVLGSTVYSA